MLSKAGESVCRSCGLRLYGSVSLRETKTALVLAMTKCAAPEIASAQLLFHPAATADSLIQHPQTEAGHGQATEMLLSSLLLTVASTLRKRLVVIRVPQKELGYSVTCLRIPSLLSCGPLRNLLVSLGLCSLVAGCRHYN